MKSILCIVTVMLASLAFVGTTVGREPPASQPVLVDVSDKSAIDAAMNKDVELEGVVSSAAWAASGKVMVIKFEKTEDTKIQAAIFEAKKEAFNAAFSGDVGKSLVGAHVRIKGRLKEFKGRPEIVINMPSQITIVEPAPSTQPSEK